MFGASPSANIQSLPTFHNHVEEHAKQVRSELMCFVVLKTRLLEKVMSPQDKKREEIKRGCKRQHNAAYKQLRALQLKVSEDQMARLSFSEFYFCESERLNSNSVDLVLSANTSSQIRMSDEQNVVPEQTEEQIPQVEEPVPATQPQEGESPQVPVAEFGMFKS
jgi:hypothetical protein